MAAKKEAVKQEENVKPTPVPFTVGFNRSQSESIVYGSLILGILFAVIGIVGNLPLLALAALAPNKKRRKLNRENAKQKKQ